MSEVLEPDDSQEHLIHFGGWPSDMTEDYVWEGEYGGLTDGTVTFLGFDQNWGGTKAHKVTHNMQYVLGVLRPLKNISTAPKPAAEPIFYTLKAGDYLGKLLAPYHLTLGQLLKLNPNIKDPNKVPVGLKVRVK